MVVKLQEEGIEDVDDLEMVDKDFLKQFIDNLKRPGNQINLGGEMVVTPYFKFDENLHMRLEADSNILRFYNTVGRAITNTVIQWDPIINYFKQ